MLLIALRSVPARLIGLAPKPVATPHRTDVQRWRYRRRLRYATRYYVLMRPLTLLALVVLLAPACDKEEVDVNTQTLLEQLPGEYYLADRTGCFCAGPTAYTPEDSPAQLTLRPDGTYARISDYAPDTSPPDTLTGTWAVDDVDGVGDEIRFRFTTSMPWADPGDQDITLTDGRTLFIPEPLGIADVGSTTYEKR